MYHNYSFQGGYALLQEISLGLSSKIPFLRLFILSTPANCMA